MRKLFTRLVTAAALCAPVLAHAFVLGPTTPGKWGSPTFGTGATVTYSFMNSGVSCAAEGAGCTISALGTFGPSFSVWKTEIENAMAAWAAVANLTFVQVADQGEAFNAAQLSGDLRFGGHSLDGPFGTLAHGYFPPVNGNSAAGDLHYDAGECWEAAMDGFGDGCFNIFQVTAHELGHALGLDHTGVPGSLMNATYTEAFTGPQADDIAGMQFIYGPATGASGPGGGGGGNLPEPAGIALVATALVAASVWRRRRTA